MDSHFCYSCMNKMTPGEDICPRCGASNEAVVNAQQDYALPCGADLHGRYLIGRMIGQGGFGITYIGYDLALEKRVCIKEYFPGGAALRSVSGTFMQTETQRTTVIWSGGESAEILRRSRESFVREARRAAKLSNLPSVVTVSEVFFENDTAYIVMEFIDGVTLKNALKERRRAFDERECFDLLRSAMLDLGRVHKLGIVHRDISPDNLMIQPDGKVVLLDLGAAKDLSDPEGHTTKLVAKKGFSPIEQYSDVVSVGPTMDVYSMCATYYYCITGKVLPTPFERMNGKSIDMSVFSPAVAAVIEKGLAIKPEARTQSMEELVAALDAAFSSEPQPQAKNKFIVVGASLAAIIAIVLLVGQLPAFRKNAIPMAEGEAAESAEPSVQEVLEPVGEPALGSAHESDPALSPKDAAQLYTEGKYLEDHGEYDRALEVYLLAAEAGNTQAMIGIGSLYYYGNGVEQSYEAALEWYKRAADHGDKESMYLLGLMYSEKGGIGPDYAEAFSWFMCGAEGGHAACMKNVGVMYYTGLGVEQEYDTAFEWFQKAAALNNTAAMYNIGVMYYDETDYDNAVWWFEKAEKSGNSTATHYLGLMHYNGEGFPQDYDAAMSCFQRVADMGNPAGSCLVGIMYQNGDGREIDYAKAARAYRDSAEAGYSDAMDHLGYLYNYGLGVNRDYKTALSWYERAVETDENPSAMANIGLLYTEGNGIARDYKIAMEWFLRSADAGNDVAMYNIGLFYLEGRGVEKDTEAAEHWFEQAAEKDNSGAMYSLGTIYLEIAERAAAANNPELSAERYQTAYNWLYLAAQNDNADAMNCIADMYRYGKGVTADSAMATLWQRKADMVSGKRVSVGGVVISGLDS